jgi:membrane-associated phospholipid phosphatase
MIRWIIKLRRLLTPVLLLVPITGESVAAQAIVTPPPAVRYSIRFQDAVMLAGTGVLGAIPSIAGTKLPYAHCAPCDSARLWGIDRGTVGLPRPGIGHISDGTLLLTGAGAAVVLAVSRHGEPEATRAAMEDLTVLAEATEVAGTVTQWAKVLFHRARPPLYTSSAAQFQGADEGRSFPSGHASFSFAAAAAAASILERRHELGSHKAEVALLFAAATTTSVLRVAAHRHFPTDVVAGAVLGSAIGWVVPRLHSVR